MLFDAICFSLSGFFMKFSDEAMDEKNNKSLAIITDFLCVFFTILVSATNGDAACIFLSILIGTALASKVDSINHMLSAILLIALFIIIDVPHFSWICLMVCIIANYLDEKGNDEYDSKVEKNKGSLDDETLLDKFFKYRYALKLTVLFFSAIGLINMVIPDLFISWHFSPITFIYFYLFDLSYEFVGLYFERIYNLF